MNRPHVWWQLFATQLAVLGLGCGAGAEPPTVRGEHHEGIRTELVADQSHESIWETARAVQQYLPLWFSYDGCDPIGLYVAMELAARDIDSHRLYAFGLFQYDSQGRWGTYWYTWRYHTAVLLTADTAVAWDDIDSSVVVDPTLSLLVHGPDQPGLFSVRDWIAAADRYSEEGEERFGDPSPENRYSVVEGGWMFTSPDDLDALDEASVTREQLPDLAPRLAGTVPTVFKLRDVEFAEERMHRDAGLMVNGSGFSNPVSLPDSDRTRRTRQALDSRTGYLKCALAKRGRLDCDGAACDEASFCPTAAFEWSADGLRVTFEDRSLAMDGFINGWQWDFGDGHTATDRNPTHTYSRAATYSVRLSATDQAGSSSSAHLDIVVPQASFCREGSRRLRSCEFRSVAERAECEDAHREFNRNSGRVREYLHAQCCASNAFCGLEGSRSRALCEMKSLGDRLSCQQALTRYTQDPGAEVRRRLYSTCCEQ